VAANRRKGTAGVQEISYKWQLEQCTAHVADSLLSSVSSLITRQGVCFFLFLKFTGPGVRWLKQTYNSKLNTR